jgi:hypothetical protein
MHTIKASFLIATAKVIIIGKKCKYLRKIISVRAD